MERLLETVRRRTDADAVMLTWTAHTPSKGLQVGPVYAQGPAPFEKACVALSGFPMSQTMSAPRVATGRNRLELMPGTVYLPAADPSIIEPWQRARLGMGLGANIASGGGHSILAFWRHDGRPAYDEADAKRFQRSLRGWSGPISEHLQYLNRLPGPTPGTVLVGAEGQIEAVSEGASRWGEIVHTHVPFLRGQPPGTHVRDRYQLTVTPFPSGAILVECESAAIGQVPEIMDLTADQRRTAALAAQGLTAEEVAKELGRSSETIRKRLRVIYARLGIASRAELARLWMEAWN